MNGRRPVIHSKFVIPTPKNSVIFIWDFILSANRRIIPNGEADSIGPRIKKNHTSQGLLPWANGSMKTGTAATACSKVENPANLRGTPHSSDDTDFLCTEDN